jgi:hypothetical protein
MNDKCPLCGTSGKIWHREPKVFVCPNCYSYYSKYGLVLENISGDEEDNEEARRPSDMWN